MFCGVRNIYYIHLYMLYILFNNLLYFFQFKKNLTNTHTQKKHYIYALIKFLLFTIFIYRYFCIAFNYPARSLYLFLSVCMAIEPFGMLSIKVKEKSRELQMKHTRLHNQ